MALKKVILIKSHGVPASIHHVSGVNVDLDRKSASITVTSFYDEDAFKASLSPLSTVTIYVDAEPLQGQSLRGWAESVLVADKPAGEPSNTPSLAYGVDRYLFSGAEIIAEIIT